VKELFLATAPRLNVLLITTSNYSLGPVRRWGSKGLEFRVDSSNRLICRVYSSQLLPVTTGGSTTADTSTTVTRESVCTCRAAENCGAQCAPRFRRPPLRLLNELCATTVVSCDNGDMILLDITEIAFLCKKTLSLSPCAERRVDSDRLQLQAYHLESRPRWTGRYLEAALAST